jgi:hypothetical protein
MTFERDTLADPWGNSADEAGSAGSIHVLPLETPDGTGQIMHPDYAGMPGWRPRHFLVATPYAFAADAVENPALFTRDDYLSWSPPQGIVNPLATSERGFLSDPDLVSIPETHELWVYYREVIGVNIINLIRSRDGVHFDSSVVVLRGPSHTIVSPSVVRRSTSDWRMWSVNSGPLGCQAAATTVEMRTSRDGLTWSTPATVSLAQRGWNVWHIDVQWIASRNEYWALYNVKDAAYCITPAVFLATSPDGLTWTTYPSPVITAGVIPEFADIVYRATFDYDAATDNVRFWFSGARKEWNGLVWRTAYQKRSRASVFASIAAPSPFRSLANIAGVSRADWHFDGW